MVDPPDISFSLLDSPWIDCELSAGGTELLSMRQIFDGSVAVRSVRGDSPQQAYAIARVLLACFWRAHRGDGPLADEDDRWRFSSWWGQALADARAGRPDARVLEYLERHRPRFDLFGPTPFMQVAALETQSGRRGEVRRLLPDSESDYFSLRAGGAATAVSFAEAARLVVGLQANDYSGIKSGAVGDPRVKPGTGRGYPIGTGWTGMTGGVLVHGETLRETLVLNTPARTVFSIGRDNDLPAWERAPDTAAERASTQPTGACDLLTWQARRIRLFTDGEQVTEVIVANGDRIPDAGANEMGDPMTPYRHSPNKSTKVHDVYYPRPHEDDRTLWRSLEPLLMREHIVISHGATGKAKSRAKPPKAPATIEWLADLREWEVLDEFDAFDVELVSFAYGAQSSSLANSVSVRIELPAQMLDGNDPLIVHSAVAASSATQEAATALGQFAGGLKQAAGGDYEFGVYEANALLDTLEPAFSDWLRGLRLERLDRAVGEWHDEVRATALRQARALIASAGPRALIGRNVTQSGTERFVSAGTALSLLQHKLTTALPRFVDDKDTPDAA